MKPLKIKLILKIIFAVVRIIQIQQVIYLQPPSYIDIWLETRKSAFLVSTGR